METLFSFLLFVGIIGCIAAYALMLLVADPLGYVPNWMAWFVYGFLTMAVVGVWSLLLWSRPAAAHQAPTGWAYPLRCCSGTDCNMIAADRVREGPDGYHVTLYPGDHDFVSETPVAYVVPYGKAEASPDGAYHICISRQLKLLCFFAGARMG